MKKLALFAALVSFAAFGAEETRLLRNLVEAHYYETGRYPATLAEIAPDTVELSHPLSTAELAEYYYVVREDEVILLPPSG